MVQLGFEQCYSVCDYLQERYRIAGVCNDDGGRLQVGGSGRISDVRNEIGTMEIWIKF